VVNSERVAALDSERVAALDLKRWRVVDSELVASVSTQS
jgi:hypothetical protein